MKKQVLIFTVSLLLVFIFAIERSGDAAVQNNPENELLDVENKITSAYLNKNLDAFSYEAVEDVSGFHASNPYRMDDRQKIQAALKTFYKYSTPTGLYKLQ